MSLDQELAEVPTISLLKLDVQGFERQVLEGARRTLQRTELLIIEVVYTSYYEGDCRFDELHHKVVSAAPFVLYGVTSPNCDDRGRPRWADAIYINQELLPIG